MANKPENPVTPVTQRYSIMAAGFGQSMLLTFVSSYLLMYLVQYARISSEGIAAVTVIMTAARIFDAVNDPFMGGLVDKTRTRWGKMRPYIIFSALPVAVFSILLYSVPEITETGKIIFFGVVYIFWGMAYTVCDVPFWGLIGAAFPNKLERGTVISNVRGLQMIGNAIGALGAVWLARILSPGGETTGAGWSYTAVILSVLGMGLFTLAFFNTREKTAPSDAPAVSVKMLLSTLLKNKPLLMVLLGSLIGFGRLILQAGGALFIVMAYNDETLFTFLGASMLGSMILAAFLTPLLLKKTSDRNIMIGSSVMGAAVNLAMYIIGYQNFVMYCVMVFLMGITLGLFMVTQTTMIADAVDYIEKKTGIRNDGISFSTLTFISKLTGSVGTLVFGIVISISGYQEGVAVTDSMLNLVYFSLTVIPAISCILSIFPFMLYKTE